MVVYCLKETKIMGPFHGIPELIAMLVTVAMQLWKKNSLLAIVLGTGTYVILVNYVFI
ncbi:MAG: AzlD domain-containing protein, partial [[Eubacterium] sulci]|nr:AzlD domain-containing protein [[Eubacterium] sulci]